MRFETITVATGHRLHYAEGGDPAGVPIVLLHGWPDSWFTYSRVVPLLSPRYRIIAPDQRGFGNSDKPSEGYSIDALADDIAALFDALSIHRAVVVGHSFGSFVARRLVLAQPARVSRLVLVGTGLTPSNPVTREVQASVRDLPREVPPAFAREFQASTAVVPLPPAFFDGIIAESCKIPGPVWRALFDALLEYDDRARLPELTVPTLVVWGEQDALFPRGDQDAVVAALPDAALTVYEATGHCPNWERPERVAADLNALIG